MVYNYAMIPINFKYDENDKLHIRRVLIEYKKLRKDEFNRDIYYYDDTRLIDVDPYFLDKSKSHQYIFEDDGYTLMDVRGDDYALYLLRGLIKDKRTYHSFEMSNSNYKAILFNASTDEEALKKFHEREELK